MKVQLKVSIWFLSFVFATLKIKAQIYPTDKLVLKHTQIMFEYPQVPEADRYQIEIASVRSSAFDKAVIYTAIDSSVAHLVDGVLSFGNKYRWHYSAYKKDKQLMVSKDYTFEITKTFLSTNFRSNAVTYDSSKIEKGLILLDNGVVIDRRGKLILVTDSFGVEKRDFSLTPNGTLTYVQTITAYEKTLNGETVWKSKEINNGKELIHGYHHDLIRLRNGNFLVMCKVKELNNPESRKNLNEGIVELDKDNNVVWLWKECTEISDTSTIKTTHLNSIFLNEERNKLFVSARDINTIFRVDRSTSKIESCIGTQLNAASEHYPHTLFSGQHSAQLLESGNILLFNNNTKMGRNSISSVLEINQPNKNKQAVSPQFSYLYMFDNPEENFCAKGGDVNKLANGNYLVSSSANNRSFEITPTKKIVWECRPEKLDTTTKMWTPIGSYRINFVKSLYPYYFTLELVYQNNKVTGYKIVNKGSENDEYDVVVKNAKVTPLDKNRVSIEVGESSAMLVDIKTLKKTTITVSSVNNSKAVRTVSID